MKNTNNAIQEKTNLQPQDTKQIKRGRGRPKGSKNKSKINISNPSSPDDTKIISPIKNNPNATLDARNILNPLPPNNDALTNAKTKSTQNFQNLIQTKTIYGTPVTIEAVSKILNNECFFLVIPRYSEQQHLPKNKILKTVVCSKDLLKPNRLSNEYVQLLHDVTWGEPPSPPSQNTTNNDTNEIQK